MKVRTRGSGRIFPRKGSAFLWCAYYLHGKEFRESTGETDPLRAQKFLNHRIKEVGADQIGKAPFIGPQQEHMKVSKLLDALEADFKLREKNSPQFRSHLKHIREYFGGWHVLEVTAEAVDTYIAKRQNYGGQTSHYQPQYGITRPGIQTCNSAQTSFNRSANSQPLRKWKCSAGILQWGKIQCNHGLSSVLSSRL